MSACELDALRGKDGRVWRGPPVAVLAYVERALDTDAPLTITFRSRKHTSPCLSYLDTLKVDGQILALRQEMKIKELRISLLTTQIELAERGVLDGLLAATPAS
jgi:hypothetical protein